MSADSDRSTPTPFLKKTYQLVDDPSIDDVISWNNDGSSFIIWNPTDFAKDVLPKHFKHNNISSFVRQLNTYGFRKVVPDRWEFANENFRKGGTQLLREIQRRKIPNPAPATTQTMTVGIPATTRISPSNSSEEHVISSNSSPVVTLPSCSSRSELAEENDKLQKENLKLNRELTQMKSLCSNIHAMMSNYGSKNSAGSPGNSTPMTKPLHLALLKQVSDEFDGACCSATSHRLFGVFIGAKRARVEKDNVEADHDIILQLQQQQQQPRTEDVKSEPLDRDMSDEMEAQCDNQRVCIDGTH